MLINGTGMVPGAYDAACHCSDHCCQGADSHLHLRYPIDRGRTLRPVPLKYQQQLMERIRAVASVEVEAEYHG
jgi:hypothetical protein